MPLLLHWEGLPRAYFRCSQWSRFERSVSQTRVAEWRFAERLSETDHSISEGDWAPGGGNAFKIATVWCKGSTTSPGKIGIPRYAVYLAAVATQMNTRKIEVGLHGQRVSQHKRSTFTRSRRPRQPLSRRSRKTGTASMQSANSFNTTCRSHEQS